MEGEGQGKESSRSTEPPPSPASRSRSRACPYLNVVVLGAGHYQVALAGGLGGRQAHHGAGVAGQLADGLEPVGEERPSVGGWIGVPWGGVGGPPWGEHVGQGTLPAQSKIEMQAQAACNLGLGGAAEVPLPQGSPALPGPLPDLLSSQMRTALPEAAYSMLPEGLRAIWLIWCSP